VNAVERALAEYVATLEGSNAFASEPVRRAFQTVQRHRFLDGWYRPEVDDLRLVFHPVEYNREQPSADELAEIYSDQAIITEVAGIAPTSSTSQPSLVARMLELMELRSGMGVLEIGTGTGYNAALLAEIVGSEGAICTIEMQEDVADRAQRHLQGEGYENVCLFLRDGFLGAPEAAPFDRIVATVGCSDISPHWLEQLASGGSLLLPLQHGLQDPLVRVWSDSGRPSRARGRIVGTSGFMPIQGALRWATPWHGSRIAGLPQTKPVWSRPSPEALAIEDGAGHPLRDDRHRAFVFFLSLGYRPLWYTNQGYGLADPGTSSAVVITRDAIEGYTLRPEGKGVDCLYDALLVLLDMWSDLDRPAPHDYDLSFIPKVDLDVLDMQGAAPGKEWVIERPFFLEIVRLP